MKAGRITVLMATVLLGLVLVVIMLIGCAPEEPEARAYQTGCYHASGGDKYICVSGGEIELQTGATLDVQSGVIWSSISNASGAITITDNVLVDGQADAVQLTVQGHTTQTSNSFVVETSAGTDKFVVDNSGNVTVTGAADLYGNVSSSAGGITITDNLLVDGQADAVQLTVQGYTTQTSKALVVETSAGTDVFAVDNDGHYFGRIDYIAKTADYTMTVAQTGALFSNAGATGEITFTLPAAAEGLNYCLYMYETYTVNVDPVSDDQVHHLTNAAGDRVQNVGTAGDSVCILGIDGTYWIPLQEIGTWSDAN